METAIIQQAGTNQKLEEQCINLLRFLSVDMVQKADSGHPGLPLDAAPMAYVLWFQFLRFNPGNPSWFNRDRFVLSAGHGSALLYSLLYVTGFELSLDDIKQFRQLGSKTPGHPERGHTPGVEVTTGPLGQGFGNGVGLAMAEAHLVARFNRPGYAIIDHYTYGIVSDGDLMEGVASEAASLAGHLKLGKLIYLYDSNHVTLSAATDLTFTEDVGKRFDAYGWQVLQVHDGNDTQAIRQALVQARAETGKPSLIIVQTHIGYGSPKQDSYLSHGSPLGEEDVQKTKRKLGWPEDPAFYVPQEALDEFRKTVDTGKQLENDWNNLFERYRKAYPELASELKAAMRADLPLGWQDNLPRFEPSEKGVSTRVASGKVLNAVASNIPALIGGSGDLNPSTHTELKGMGDFESPLDQEPNHEGSCGGSWDYSGRNIAYGVREHAMGTIMNGLAAHGGFIPFGGTFLTFSDYMRPPIRLAALMGLQVIYAFTHDSIALGEDGPTHQPVEQVASLRAIPRMIVIRPADANETVVAWQVALETRNHPTSLILTRQNLLVLDRSRFAAAEGLRRGAYILEDADQPQLILIATGSEVSLIVEAADKLNAEGIQARLVSMPSWELFDMQPDDYKRSVLPPELKIRLAVEAGVPQGWEKYVGDDGDVLGIDQFGASGPACEVLKKFGFTAEYVVERAKALLERNGKLL
jgi:transketolase